MKMSGHSALALLSFSSVVLARRPGIVSRLQGRLELDFNCIGCTGLSPPTIQTSTGAQPSDFLVTPQIGNFPSYAGFIQTNAQLDNNMFFWYFPAQSGDQNAPLLIWLQGGPGGASLFGLFAEMGPLGINDDVKSTFQRTSTWNQKYSMIFIDNPVGAGFSYTGTGSYCNNTKTDVSSNLYAFIQQFYTIFTHEQKNHLYITGESYGGHYVPAFAFYIHEQNQKLEASVDAKAESVAVRVPLAGIAVGDGWIDPVQQMQGYPDMMFNIGMADMKQKAVIQSYCDQTVAHIQAGDMRSAFHAWDEMLNGDIFPYPNYFHNISGSNDYDNFMNTNAPASFNYYASFCNQESVRKAIHVGNATLNNGHMCEEHLVEDFMVSLKPELTALLDSQYKVLIYSGQLDVIIGAALTERFLFSVPWGGMQKYRDADRKVWRIHPSDSEVAGYVREVDNLTQVVVRGAGHIVPGDQPERALDMISRFVESRPYSSMPDPTPGLRVEQFI